MTATSFSRAGGFTLLEILIATMVAAFVLLAINGTYFGALKIYNSAQASLDRGAVLYRALDLIRRDVAGLMVPAATPGSTPTPPVGTFAGEFQDTPANSPSQEFTATRVSPDFYTTSGTVDGWNPFSEVQVVTYYLAQARDGSNTKSLVRAVTRNLLPVSQPTTDEQTLLSGVEAVTFDYYDGTQWDPTWDSTATFTLPQAIRCRITFTKNSGLPSAGPVQLVIPVVVVSQQSQTQLMQANGNP